LAVCNYLCEQARSTWSRIVGARRLQASAHLTGGLKKFERPGFRRSPRSMKMFCTMIELLTLTKANSTKPLIVLRKVGRAYSVRLVSGGAGGLYSCAPRRLSIRSVRSIRALGRRLRELFYVAEKCSIADIRAFTWVMFAVPTVWEKEADARGDAPTVDRRLDLVSRRSAVQLGLWAGRFAIGKGRPSS
jgi:hypothetical protein